MIKTEHILEFDKIKETWKTFALTENARTEIEKTKPMMSERQVAARLRETSEAKNMIEKFGQPPLATLNNIREWMNIAEIGGCLSPEQLEEAEKALVAVERMKKYLCQGKNYHIPLAFYEENLYSCQEIREAISRQIRGGQVCDGASRTLKSCRQDIEKEERAMREKADNALRANKSCMADSFSTLRNGHICIPVKSEFKSRIKGNIIDRSSTGSTVFIEPTAAARHYDVLQLLYIEEENEVRRILYVLTDMLYQQKEVIEQDLCMMEKMDFIFSKAKLSLEYDGTEPVINTERRIVIKDGRHPLMDKKICVPLQFSVGNGVNGIVITGPNTGGKTVALKTVALNCMMAQSGLHVTCRHFET